MKYILSALLFPLCQDLAVCQTVANLNDSGPGSLRQTISDL
jgi:hypothetical protein